MTFILKTFVNGLEQETQERYLGIFGISSFRRFIEADLGLYILNK